MQLSGNIKSYSSNSLHFPGLYLTNKKAKAVYYTVIKHDKHLRTRSKCRKHKTQASVFFISRVFSKGWSII